MKLADLTKNVKTMTDDELLAHVRSIRSNKYVAKPAVAKRAADVEKKERNKGTVAVNKAIAGMSDADKAALLKLLEEDNG